MPVKEHPRVIAEQGMSSRKLTKELARILISSSKEVLQTGQQILFTRLAKEVTLRTAGDSELGGNLIADRALQLSLDFLNWREIRDVFFNDVFCIQDSRREVQGRRFREVSSIRRESIGIRSVFVINHCVS